MDDDHLTHLNGNAVYNVSHPCFRMILEKMEEENSGTQPFDVAIRRIIREFYPECDDAYKQTSTIDNLATTVVSADELSRRASYVHGAKLVLPVNGAITAIVSTFGGQSSATTIRGLMTGQHGFSHVIVVDDHGEPGSLTDFGEVQRRGARASSHATIRIMNMTRYPGISPARDFCLALEEVETPYFSISNVFRVPTNLRPIMDSQGKFMVPCLPSSSIYCDESCENEAEAAGVFAAPPNPQPTEKWFIMEGRRLGMMDVPLMPEGGVDGTCVINGDAMIWASESARRYCSLLEETLPKPSTDDCSQVDATATSYLTYLQSTGEFDDEYKFYLKEQWGERSMFLPFMDIPPCQDELELPEKDGVMRSEHQSGGSWSKSPTNSSLVCQLITDETTCKESPVGCDWREDFNGRCHLAPAPRPRPSMAPTILPTAASKKAPVLATLPPPPSTSRRILSAVPPAPKLQPGISIVVPSWAPLLIAEDGTLNASFTVQLTTAPLSRVWIEFGSKFGQGAFV